MSIHHHVLWNHRLTTETLVDVNGANWGYKTAWLFFSTGAVTCVVVYFFVPEPSQRNPAELDEMYEKGVPAWKMSKFMTDVQIGQQQAKKDGRA